MQEGDFVTLDGSDWVLHKPGLVSPVGMNDVLWNGSKFVGVKGWTYTSLDGIGWTVSTTTMDELVAVAWSDVLNLHIAVGEDGLIMSSSDGSAWNLESSPSVSWLNDVIWGNGRFIAVGENGTILSSSNGSVWSTVFSGTTVTLTGVTWSGRAFVAVGGSDLQSVIWDGSQFVAVGDQGKVLTSADGDTWTYDSSGDGADFLLDIAWSGSLYAVGAQSFIYNFDQSGWSAGQWLGATTSCSGMMWEGSQFVRVGSGAGGAATWTSADGNNFTYHDPGAGSASVLRGVAWNGTDQYVAVGYDGLIISSANGSIWSTEISNTLSNLFRVNHGDGQYVAVGASGSIVTSPNGTFWSAQDSTISSSLYNVAYTGTEYVAVGASGRIVTSGGGASWSADQHTFTAYNGVAWNGTTLVIVGDDGTVIRRQ